MSRRKTVNLNVDFATKKIKEVFRHNVIFCEKMGRGNHLTWVTDWNRKDKDGNPAPKNLPSPEEAAKMCILLQTTPEEILLEPEDIALVNDLLEQEKGAKKAPGQKAEGEMLDIETQRELVRQAISNTNDLGELLDMMDAINRKIRELK